MISFSHIRYSVLQAMCVCVFEWVCFVSLKTLHTCLHCIKVYFSRFISLVNDVYSLIQMRRMFTRNCWIKSQQTRRSNDNRVFFSALVFDRTFYTVPYWIAQIRNAYTTKLIAISILCNLFVCRENGLFVARNHMRIEVNLIRKIVIVIRKRKYESLTLCVCTFLHSVSFFLLESTRIHTYTSYGWLMTLFANWYLSREWQMIGYGADTYTHTHSVVINRMDTYACVGLNNTTFVAFRKNAKNSGIKFFIFISKVRPRWYFRIRIKYNRYR